MRSGWFIDALNVSLQNNYYAFYWSTVPNIPSSLQANCIDESIRLIWTAPEEDLFRTKYYYIEVATSTNWEDKHGFQVPAFPLEHNIKNITLDKTYCFKIYAVSGSVRSKARSQTCLSSRKLNFYPKN